MLVELNTGLVDKMSMDTYSEFSPDDMLIDDEDNTEENWDKFSFDKYKELMVDAFKQVYLNETMPLLNSDSVESLFGVEIVDVANEMDSPREYNFATDTLDFTLDINIDLCIGFAMADAENFNKWLGVNFTTRSGFLSHTANNFIEWSLKFKEGRAQEVGAFLSYFTDISDMQTEFSELVREIWFDQCLE